MNGKRKKIIGIALLLLLVWMCRPMPETEKDISWIWYEIGFWSELETEAELTEEERAAYAIKIREFEPFQFEQAKLQTCAFSYGDRRYVFSPEAGLLFEVGLEYDKVIKLTESKGKYNGLYALGAIQKDGFLYYAEAEEKKRFRLFGLFHGEGILAERYELTYHCFDIKEEGTFSITEEEYMKVRDTLQKTE